MPTTPPQNWLLLGSITSNRGKYVSVYWYILSLSSSSSTSSSLLFLQLLFLLSLLIINHWWYFFQRLLVMSTFGGLGAAKFAEHHSHKITSIEDFFAYNLLSLAITVLQFCCNLSKMTLEYEYEPQCPQCITVLVCIPWPHALHAESVRCWALIMKSKWHPSLVLRLISWLN